jgi:hypothetical protein
VQKRPWDKITVWHLGEDGRFDEAAVTLLVEALLPRSSTHGDLQVDIFSILWLGEMNAKLDSRSRQSLCLP